MKHCKVPNCLNAHYSKELCKVHYDKNRRQGDPMFVRVLGKELPCKVDGCQSLRFANDLCPKHNRRLQRHGDPLFVNAKCNRDGNSKARTRSKTALWKKKNKETYNAYLASRKKRVRQATPKWADIQAIRDFYYSCPEGFHVDHIIPLNGKNVSGLHIIGNLQYLPALENLRKSNKVA